MVPVLGKNPAEGDAKKREGVNFSVTKERGQEKGRGASKKL